MRAFRTTRSVPDTEPTAAKASHARPTAIKIGGGVGAGCASPGGGTKAVPYVK
jgi:hypothetical protein